MSSSISFNPPAKLVPEHARRFSMAALNQDLKVMTGFGSGKLTHAERDQLNAQLDRFEDAFSNALKDDKVSPQEARKLSGMLQRSAQAINKAMNNDATWDPNYYRREHRLLGG